MSVPKKYIYQSGANKGKINLALVQTGLPDRRRGDKHPHITGLFFITYRNGRKNPEQWGSYASLQKLIEKNRKHKLLNPEYYRDKRRKYIAQHPERIKETNRKSKAKRRAEGKEQAYKKLYNKANPGVIAEINRKQRLKRKENGKTQAYNQQDHIRIDRALRSRLNNAIKDGNKSAKSIELFGASPLQIKAHLESQFTEGMSWDNYGEWHIDHIIPCAFFDMTKPSHQKVCFNWQNLQPLWAEENRSKSDKIPWYVLLTILMNNYKTITV